MTTAEINWTNCTLGDAVNLKRGYDLPERDRMDGEYPIVSSSGVTGSHNVAMVRRPGVVTGRYGTLGKVFYVPSDYWPLNTTLYVQDFKGNHPLFISYLLQTLNFGQRSGASAVPGVNRNALHMLRIRKPDLSTQRKIAVILSAYDDLIENNLRRIKILEEMAQNLYREWFVKFHFPGHKHVRFIDSPLGRIPQGWECAIVNNFLSLKSGFAFKSSTFIKDGIYGLVTIKNVHDGLFVTNCTSRIEELPPNMPSYCHVSDGDILLSLTGNIGRTCLVYGENYLLNQRVAKLVPHEASHRAYTYLTFRQDEFQTKLTKIANGVAQQNLSPIDTGIMQIVFPALKVLADFSEICEPTIDHMLILFKKNQNLRHTRDLLLPRLISGEVDVSELDITVPEEAA